MERETPTPQSPNAPTPSPISKLPEQPESLTWRVRLSDNAPWKRWVVLGVAVLGGLLGFALMRNALIGVLGFAIILASTAEFWLGTVYRIDAGGATARTGISPTSMTWSDVKRAIVTAEGVKLSPLGEDGRLSPFRGVFLRFGSDNRDQILSAVRTHCDNDVRFLEG
jgi:hypothetical protein